jgi:hypothetical protein
MVKSERAARRLSGAQPVVHQHDCAVRRLSLSLGPVPILCSSTSASLLRLAFLFSTSLAAAALELRSDGYHVFPRDSLQDAIELAARNPTNKKVKVHPGTYRPHAKRQALIWFNRIHDGVRVEALGEVALSAANPDLSSPAHRTHPAVVNHVVYFGDGISSNTVLRGFRITGANGYVTDKFLKQIEPDESVPKNSFFLTDGGAVKIFGRSYPVLENLEIVDNYTTPCGGGISVQHQGFNTNYVVIRNCIFRHNRAQVTGAAVDLLEGSAAHLINCLFVENASNLGVDVIARRSGEPPFTNSGVLTVFQESRALVERCTFTANRNAVDDMSGLGTYRDCIFYQNNVLAGQSGERYELDLPRGGIVENCLIAGKVIDPKKAISSGKNTMNAEAPKFSAEFIPQSPAYKKTGYRPITRAAQ